MSFLSISARAVVVPFVFAAVAGVSQGAETVVQLPNGIVGTLAVPEGGASGPAVVMLHGFGSSRDEVGGLRKGSPRSAWISAAMARAQVIWRTRRSRA